MTTHHKPNHYPYPNPNVFPISVSAVVTRLSPSTLWEMELHFTHKCTPPRVERGRPAIAPGTTVTTFTWQTPNAFSFAAWERFANGERRTGAKIPSFYQDKDWDGDWYDFARAGKENDHAWVIITEDCVREPILEAIEEARNAGCAFAAE
jgi:hypothetical protein